MPKNGVYLFFFNALIDSSDDSLIYVYVNGEIVQTFENFNAGESEDRQMSLFWSMDLNQGDEMFLYNYFDSSIYITDVYRMYFMGVLTN